MDEPGDTVGIPSPQEGPPRDAEDGPPGGPSLGRRGRPPGGRGRGSPKHTIRVSLSEQALLERWSEDFGVSIPALILLRLFQSPTEESSSPAEAPQPAPPEERIPRGALVALPDELRTALRGAVALLHSRSPGSIPLSARGTADYLVDFLVKYVTGAGRVLPLEEYETRTPPAPEPPQVPESPQEAPTEPPQAPQAPQSRPGAATDPAAWEKAGLPQGYFRPETLVGLETLDVPEEGPLVEAPIPISILDYRPVEHNLAGQSGPKSPSVGGVTTLISPNAGVPPPPAGIPPPSSPPPPGTTVEDILALSYPGGAGAPPIPPSPSAPLPPPLQQTGIVAPYLQQTGAVLTTESVMDLARRTGGRGIPGCFPAELGSRGSPVMAPAGPLSEMFSVEDFLAGKVRFVDEDEE